jgi:hypothetical protein
MLRRAARTSINRGVLIYVDPKSIAAPQTAIFETGIKIRPGNLDSRVRANDASLPTPNVLNCLNILSVLNPLVSSQRPDLLHARVEADVSILGRISQNPYRVFAVSRSIDGFFDHRAQ